ncbi:MAG TPA: DUF58 domain-containing protein [Acidimicrobiales bacterium]
MLTRQGWLVAGGGVVLLALARLFGIEELYVFGACALVLVLFSAAYVGVKRLELEVDRTVSPARVHASGASRVDVRVRNLRLANTPVLRLTEPVTGTPGAELLVPPLDPGAAAVASYRLPTERRGILEVGPLGVVVSDPFGLAQATVQAAERVEVTVYPAVAEIQPAPFTTGQDPLAGTQRPHALGRVGDDFYALRPYVVGDDLRRIHWPSTARHDELLVRQQEQPWQGRTTVLLDVRRATYDPVAFEIAVSAAASIVTANGTRRDLVRLVTTDGTDSGYGVGHAHVQALLEHLAVIQTTSSASLRTMIEVLYKTGGGALVVVVAQTTTDELTGIGRLRQRFGWTAIVQTDGARAGAAARIGAAAAGTRAGVAGVAGASGAVPVVAADSLPAFAASWDRLVASQRSGGRPLTGAIGGR